MSTQEFARLLAEYVIKRQLPSDEHDTDNGSGSFSATVWSDIEKIFTTLTNQLGEINAYNTAICEQAFPASTHKSQAIRVVCRRMVNIFLFMDGLDRAGKNSWVKREDRMDEWTFERYIRCMMGNVALIELFWNNCAQKAMVETVSMYMHPWREATNYNDNSRWCNDLDYNTLVVGTKYVGLTMAEWIRSWKHENQKGRVGTNKARRTCAAGGTPGTVDSAVAAQDRTPIVRIFHEGEADNVHKAVEQGQTFTQDQRDKLIARLKQERARADGFKSVVENAGQPASAKPAPSKPVAPEATETPQVPAAQHSGVHDGSGSDDDYVATTTKQDARTPQADKPAATKPATTKPVTGGGGDKNGAKPSAPSAAGTSGTGTSSGQPRSDSSAGEGQPAAAGSGAGGQGPGQAPGPGQQPPPPPPPPEPARPAAPKGEQGAASSTGGSTTPTNKSGAEAQTPQATVTNNEKGETQGKKAECTKHVTESHAGQSGRGQYADPIDDSRGGTGGSSVSFTVAVTTPECSDTGTDNKSGAGGPAPPAAPAHAQPGPTESVSATATSTSSPVPTTTTTSSSGADAASPGPPGLAGKVGESGPSGPGSSGPGSTGHQNPGSSGTGSTGDHKPGSSGPGSTGHTNNENVEAKGNEEEKLPADAPITPSLFPELKWEDVKPYTPAIIPAVVGIGIIAFFLWKYFAHLGHKRRRTYRTVRDVPSPPLDEEILEHLQRGELPPPDYGYTMVTPPASAADRRAQRPPRVHTRTIIDLHLEVLHECEAADWENVKDDYLHILVEEFMGDGNGHSSSLDAPITNQALSRNNVPSTESDGIDRCPRNDDNPDPWSYMQTIQLATNPCAPNEDNPDPWNCMETIQLDTEPDPHSSPRNECPTPDHTYWMNWIDRNKHLVQDCTTQPWFLQLKADWKQYYQQHSANEDNAASGDHRKAATMESKKHAWKEWVAKQHALMHIYGEDEWFHHLLVHIQEETVPDKGEVPIAEKALELDKVMAAEDVLRVTDVPRTQLHRQLYLHKPLSTKIWILLLALVIEQCELERRLQETELYVDDLLQTC
ncbi:hypothetical protein AK88_04599 [Plasmodium fragile]|uniref:Schizont-infected cell agglutination C-terminal domain-containing protein n=1 Tax=Plasmodium fragile TaxID=5857 RepID=A0A0D9QFM5_PLAFR|nr:uncharacterized protein AK88_04599 [Plasmodium fragile]KJP85783.1 hypothetical protein AK88_04599 [Plasmodium fragile]